MNYMTSNSVRMMEKSMDFLWTKQTVILDNIANAETPNYKPKVVNFEEGFRAKLGYMPQQQGMYNDFSARAFTNFS